MGKAGGEGRQRNGQAERLARRKAGRGVRGHIDSDRKAAQAVVPPFFRRGGAIRVADLCHN